MICARIAASLHQPKLHIHITTPELPQRGIRWQAVCAIRNDSSRPVFGLQADLSNVPDGWRVPQPLPVIDVIPPGKTHKLSVDVVVTRRGVTQFPDFQFVSEYPFHLFRVRLEVPSDASVTIGPYYEADTAGGLLSAGTALVGDLQRIAAGLPDHDDYIGSREYSPGMAVRRWDIPSSARLGKPVVREFASTTQGDAILVLDNTSAHPFGEDPNVERVISLAASLGVWLLEQDWTVTTVIGGNERFPIARSSQSVMQDHLVRTLATFDYSPRFDAESVADRVDNEDDGACVFLITHCWAVDQQRLFARLSESRRMLTAIVATPADQAAATVADANVISVRVAEPPVEPLR